MEIVFKGKKIEFERKLSDLDIFVMDFVGILDRLKIRYVIVSGYVPILFGRPRVTEDIDLLADKVHFDKFNVLWNNLIKKYDCLNARNSQEAYSEYLMKNAAIRFSRKGQFIPNMEFKFAKDNIDTYSMSNSIEVKLNKNRIIISPIEMQIVYKLYLGSEKDLEDSKFLYDILKNNIDRKELKTLINNFKINKNTASKYLKGFYNT